MFISCQVYTTYTKKATYQRDAALIVEIALNLLFSPGYKGNTDIHIIARYVGGTDHIENLQLLCGHCNRIKGDRGQEYLISRLNAS